MTQSPDIQVSADEFRDYQAGLQLGTLGPRRRARRAQLPDAREGRRGHRPRKRSGRTVTLSRPLNTEREPDNPEPADHHMTMLGAKDHPDGLAFVKDYIGVDYHNDSHSHLDALCHVSYDGSLYNGRPADSVSATGAASRAVELLKDGLIGRGVLLDMPRTRGVSWLEPGDSVLPGDLDEAERRVADQRGRGRTSCSGADRATPLVWTSSAPGTRAAPRLGCTRSVRTSCPSDGSLRSAATATAIRRHPSRRGSDFPSTCWRSQRWVSTCSTTCSSTNWPGACEEAGRWEFLFLAAPLRIAGGTGSPLNPIAIL